MQVVQSFAYPFQPNSPLKNLAQSNPSSPAPNCCATAVPKLTAAHFPRLMAYSAPECKTQREL
jgi:hypothetical protein